MSELERIIHDNSNGLDYILVGEIYLPLIAVPEEKREIGFYGSLHRNYLKDYKSGLYSYLTLSGKLWTYLADLNEQCFGTQGFPHGTDYGAGRHYERIEKQRSDGMGSPGKQCKKPGR